MRIPAKGLRQEAGPHLRVTLVSPGFTEGIGKGGSPGAGAALLAQRDPMAMPPSTIARTVAHVPEIPTGLGWLPDGRLLIATQRGQCVLPQEHDGRLTVRADLTGTAVSNLNDMWIDSHGRAYVGELGFDAEALLAQILQPAAPSREAVVASLITAGREHPGRIGLTTTRRSTVAATAGVVHWMRSTGLAGRWPCSTA